MSIVCVFYRSANGTPVKSRDVRDSDDPATMIALALRKRFAQMNQVNDSPERDRDRDDREDSFSESTEDLFGSHITPKYATPRPKGPSPRKLFVFTRPAAVSSIVDKGKENGQTPVHLTTKLKNTLS